MTTMRYFQNAGKTYGYDGNDPTQEALITAAIDAKWTEVTGSWPPAPSAGEQLAIDAAKAASQGLTITCTSTSALDGVYAVDQAAQARINAIETAIIKNGSFPGSSGSQMAYPKIDGTLVVFPSTSLFSEFATAVANYVADLDLYAAGASGASLPASSVTIA